MEPGTLSLLLCKGKEREFHVDTRHMAKHLFELDLLGVHEESVGDFCGADFLALAAVHAGIRNMSVPNKVEHEADGQLAGWDIGRVLGCSVNAVTNWAGLDTPVALYAACSLGHNLL